MWKVSDNNDKENNDRPILIRKAHSGVRAKKAIATCIIYYIQALLVPLQIQNTTHQTLQKLQQQKKLTISLKYR